MSSGVVGAGKRTLRSLAHVATAAVRRDLYRLQVLTQAGTSMLAQANQSTQSILKLLG